MLHSKRHMTHVAVNAAMRVGTIALLLVIVGCTINAGRFSMNAQVDQDFRTGQAQPGSRYFYAGRDTMPYAIIGIDRSYSVPSRYWIPFEPEADTLKKMSGNMYGKMRYNPYGSHILDPDGNIIGVWYSSVYHYSASIDQQNRTVQVLFKNPENARHM